MDKILAMKPCRELDGMVAEKVMELETYRSKEDWIQKRMPHIAEWSEAVEYPAYWLPMCELATMVPEYSNDITVAWEVIERMVTLGWSYNVNFIKDHRYPEGVNHCCFSRPMAHISAEDALYIDQSERMFFHGHCETAPEAICKAALLAKEAKPK